MKTKRGGQGARRRGLTLLELTLALSVTAMVGLGVAATLTLVGRGSEADREARSLLLRAHAAQTRFRAYLEPALSLLQYDEAEGVALWLHDQETPGKINLSEVRVIWINKVAGKMIVEWVSFPEEWTELQKAAFDTAVDPGTSFFTVMEEQRAAGFTALLDLMDGLEHATMAFDTEDVQQARRAELRMEFLTSDGRSSETMSTFGLKQHTDPGA